MQQAVCRRINVPFVKAEPELKAGIALDSLQRLPLNGIRRPIENGTNGWYIWGGEYSQDPEFFQPLCTLHLDEHCCNVLPCLGLAPGFGFVIDTHGYEDVFYDEKYVSQLEE